MGGPVLAEADAVMRPDVDHAPRAQRREANAWPHVIRECQERGPIGQDAAMACHAGENRRHDVLADTEMNVPAGITPVTSGSALRRRFISFWGNERAFKI